MASGRFLNAGIRAPAGWQQPLNAPNPDVYLALETPPQVRAPVFTRYAIPVPVGQGDLSWALNLVLTTFQAPPPVLLTFPATDWPRQESAFPDGERYSWTLNLLASTLAPPPVPVNKPLAQYDWPLPAPIAALRHPDARSWTLNLTPLLTLAAPPVRPFAQYDWPLPAIRRPHPDDLDEIATLIPVPLPFAQTEWPLPPQPLPQIESWTQNLLDSTLALGGPIGLFFRQRDFPLPPQPQLQPESWTQNLLESTLGLPPPVPLFIINPVYELPPSLPYPDTSWFAGPIIAEEIQTRSREAVLEGPPPDLPEPEASWTLNLLAGTLSLPPPAALFVINPPFPLPPQPDPQREIRDWSLNLLESTLSLAALKPFRPQVWPNPDQPIRPADERSWTAGFVVLPVPFIPEPQGFPPQPLPVERSWSLNLLASTLSLTPIGTLRFARRDWPLPEVAPEAPDARSWTQNLLESTLTLGPPVILPFRQFDWPLPPQPQRQPEGIVWQRLVPAYQIKGITRDGASGTPLPFCDVFLFYTASNVLVAQTTSDASGYFSFIVSSSTDLYYLVAFDPGAPTFGGTRPTVTPVML